MTTSDHRSGSRPFLIGAAFALIVAGGVVAFFALRNRGADATPRPGVVTVPGPSNKVSNPDGLPAIQTTLPGATGTSTTGTPTTAASTTAIPTTVSPATTATGVPDPGTSTPATIAPPAPTAPPSGGTVAPATATLAPRPSTAPASTSPGATPTSGFSNFQASSTRAGGFDSCGAPTEYSASNIADGQLDTAWMTVGDGVNQYVEFTLAAGTTVRQVGLVPGYAKQDPCTGTDSFPDMRRIQQVQWTFDNGNSLKQTFDTSSPTMQMITLKKPLTPTVVRITIRATAAPGNPAYNYTPISEVSVA
ncbi:MAG: discoidin domain-containing protein [Ilumatobacteraceae bacterium]